MNRPWEIRHIELTEDLPALAPEERAAGNYAVFWAHDVPLGHRFIPAKRLPLTSAALRELALQEITPALTDHLSIDAPHSHGALPEQPLAALREHLEARATPMDATEASVVVCTRDRPTNLDRCLQSLLRLTPPPLEIIVVDNAPKTEDTRQLVAEMPEVRYVREPRPGLDIARNAGVRHSTGTVIAFTDDDVQVHPRWLERLCRGFSDSKVMAVTGLVFPDSLETEAQLLFERHWGFNRGYCARLFGTRFFSEAKSQGVPVWEIGAGASMAFRRKAFEEVGGFDERLDVGAAGCSGDSEFWYRLLTEGWHCRYEPSAVAFHSHRRRLDKLQHQLFNYMRGHTAALLIQHEKHEHWGNLRRLLLSLPKYYTRLLIKGMGNGFQGRYRTLWSEIRGVLSGFAYYLRHRHTPSHSSPFASRRWPPDETTSV